MIAATMTSGQALPPPGTPNAAATTATLEVASGAKLLPSAAFLELLGRQKRPLDCSWLSLLLYIAVRPTGEARRLRPNSL